MTLAFVACGQAQRDEPHEWVLEALREPSAVVIGRMERPAGETFGEITDVAIAEDGGLAILDAVGYRLSVFSAEGRLLAAGGREGQGPGELRYPTDLTVDGRGRFLILDPGNARISVFEFSGGELRHVADSRVNKLATQLCAAGERRFVLQARERELIGEIDANGTTMDAFGDPVWPGSAAVKLEENAFTRGLFGQGLIACDSRGGRLVYASIRAGEVRLYTLEGELLWRTWLPDFVPEQVTAPGGNCCQFEPDPEMGGSMSIAGLSIDGNRIFVSVDRFSRSDRGHNVRVLRIEDGVEIAREEAPLRVREVRAGVILGVQNQPFPAVRIYGRVGRMARYDGRDSHS